MLDVFLTVDVEIWCDGWDDIDAKFSECFQKYVYGNTSKGDFGLPFQARQLKNHGLTGVFFTEPLFSTRFGGQPLAEIVGLLLEGSQQIELHLHPEWADEARIPLLPNLEKKLPTLRGCGLDQQQLLIETGLRLLRQAGAPAVSAFRAGSFGFDRNTLRAVARAGLQYDSSYNASMGGADSGIGREVPLDAPGVFDDVTEVPMTCFDEGTSRLRHAQLTACSWSELESMLWLALEQQRQTFVVLWHNFELLSPSKTRVDETVLQRFNRLCKFLDQHRDCFRTRGFPGFVAEPSARASNPLRSSRWRTAARMAEQVYRRRWT